MVEPSLSVTRIESILLHPVTHYILQNAVSIAIIGFTSPASIVRYAALPPMVLCSWILMPTYLERTQRTILAAFLSGGVMSSILGYIDTALLTKWSFETDGPSTTVVPKKDADRKSNSGGRTTRTVGSSSWKRLRFGYAAAYANRYCGTPHEVPHVPPFSYRDPTYVPSRGKFLLDKAAVCLVSYLVLDLAGSNSQPGKNKVLYSAEEVPLFGTRGISRERLQVRLYTTLGFWVANYCVVQLVLGVSALIRVAIGLDGPKYWRPIFGSLSEAYSIRRFWR